MATASEIYNSLNQIFPRDISRIILEKLCICRMRDYLESKFIDSYQLFDLLYKHKCIIAGSFPLTCLLNERVLKKSNINIFGKCMTDPIFEMDLAVILRTEDVTFVHRPLLCYRYVKLFKKEEQFSKQEVCRTKRDKAFLNVEYMSVYSDPIKFVRETSDLSFCKVIFDGVKLHVHNFDMTIKKEGTVDLNMDAEAMLMIKDTYNQRRSVHVHSKTEWTRDHDGYNLVMRNPLEMHSRGIAKAPYHDYIEKNCTCADVWYVWSYYIHDIKYFKAVMTAIRIITYKLRGYKILFTPLLK